MHGNKHQQARHGTLRLGKTRTGQKHQLADLRQKRLAGILTPAKSHKLPENIPDQERQASHFSRCAYTSRRVYKHPNVMFRGTFECRGYTVGKKWAL